jgi:hypothetical protein
MAFEARYSGVCACCQERFEKGTPLVYNEDGDLVVKDCPNEGLRSVTAPAGRVCGGCFVELPVTGICSQCT